MKTFLEEETSGLGIGLHGIRRRVVLQTEIADGIVDVRIAGGTVEKLTPRRLASLAQKPERAADRASAQTAFPAVLE